MKSNLLTIAIATITALSRVGASTANLPMGVEIMERDGRTLVREVISDAGNAFISVTVAQLEMEVAMAMSMEAALGVATIANLSVFRMENHQRNM
ncbi:hypothetical protein UCREL1_6016 [Eutypa lata UCREL1]|uniref:Uncharacterized protein n=1 Tax=Eutypa lata (strain UCR-EL1) TaxID=1287681 RepID=M7SKV9_EUTLA|nr:hypothetical protein UCREL1_6016 [Eutypa lata UCREL1]